MQIERQQSLSMVNHHAIPFKEQRPRQDDTSAIHGCNCRSSGNAKIEALMRALNGTVEDALDSKHVGNLGIHWSSKRPPPHSLSAQSLEGFGFGRLVLFDLALLVGTWRGITRRNLQYRAWIPLAFYANLLFEGKRSGVFVAKHERIGSWFRLQADSREREP